MSGAPLTLERDGDVGVLFLDAPPRNVMGEPFFDALAAMTRDVLPGLDVAGLVVRGRGRHFSAGADVPRLCRLAASRAPDTLDVLAANSAAFTSLERLPYPTVAAIDGVCLGSGLELALACRWRIATPSALFASPEAEFGLIPGCGGSVRLPERIGTGAALDLFLSARHLDAEEAFRLGLVDALLPRADLGPAASRLVRRLALQEGRAA